MVGVVSGFITPAKVEVSNLKFYIDDDLIAAFHSKQPYVTMAMDVKAIGQAIHEQKMKIQMTVSSRYYEWSLKPFLEKGFNISKNYIVSNKIL